MTPLWSKSIWKHSAFKMSTRWKHRQFENEFASKTHSLKANLLWKRLLLSQRLYLESKSLWKWLLHFAKEFSFEANPLKTSALWKCTHFQNHYILKVNIVWKRVHFENIEKKSSLKKNILKTTSLSKRLYSENESLRKWIDFENESTLETWSDSYNSYSCRFIIWMSFHFTPNNSHLTITRPGSFRRAIRYIRRQIATVERALAAHATTWTCRIYERQHKRILLGDFY